MENESSISWGGTKILLALFAQNLMFGEEYILSPSSNTDMVVERLKWGSKGGGWER